MLFMREEFERKAEVRREEEQERRREEREYRRQEAHAWTQELLMIINVVTKKAGE